MSEPSTKLVSQLTLLMHVLSAREEGYKAACEKGEMTHEEASSAALECRWMYAQLAALLFPFRSAEGK